MRPWTKPLIINIPPYKSHSINLKMCQNNIKWGEISSSNHVTACCWEEGLKRKFVYKVAYGCTGHSVSLNLERLQSLQGIKTMKAVYWSSHLITQSGCSILPSLPNLLSFLFWFFGSCCILFVSLFAVTVSEAGNCSPTFCPSCGFMGNLSPEH